MSVTVCRVTLVKRFIYRDQPEEFSNSYAFKLAPPAEGDTASWLQLYNDIVAREQHLFTSDVTFVHAYGYNSSDPKQHHVDQHDFEVPGPAPKGTRTSTGNVGAGDQAAVVEFKMNRLNKKGKPIYLRKYLHQPEVQGVDHDQLDTTYYSILVTYSDIGPNGIQSVHGGLRTGLDNNGVDAPNDSVVATVVPNYVTTRTLKRRGKRPRTGN
jgi:hypothetical protein